MDAKASKSQAMLSFQEVQNPLHDSQLPWCPSKPSQLLLCPEVWAQELSIQRQIVTYLGADSEVGAENKHRYRTVLGS